MKARHNKKRNTAFLFEALVLEITKSVVSDNKQRTSAAKKILSEHFRKGDILYEEMDCYKSLAGRQGLGHQVAEKILSVAKDTYKEFDFQEIFKEQSQVIKKINTTLDKSVYNNFVPNYKSFATIAQIFGDKAPIKNKVLMEQNLIEELSMEPSEMSDMKPVDSLVVSSFTKRYNERYGSMLKEQRNLLGKYIISFGQNEIDFRIHVGTELNRLREKIEESLVMDEIREDKEMVKSTRAVLEQMNTLNVSNIKEEDILKILKLQKLVSEYQSDAN